MFALLASLIICASTLACDFSSDVKSVYSLAGSVSLAFRDLGLIKSPKLKGVSVFHPVHRKSFTGTFLPGGVFLSHQTLSELSGSLLFYDESRELTRILDRYKEIKKIEIRTRNLTPQEVEKNSETVLKPFVTNCDLPSLSANLEKKLSLLKEIIPKNKTLLLFLGLLTEARTPDLLMVNDGIVKWMVQEKLIKSYPSKLSYVNWSSKVMQGLPRDSLRVGVKDSGSEMITKVEKKPQHINLVFPGALIPGTGQVDAMIYLFNNF